MEKLKFFILAIVVGLISIPSYMAIPTQVTEALITTDQIADNAITSPKLANGEVKTLDLSDNSVTSDKIANGQVNTNDITDGAITASKLAFGAIKAQVTEHVLKTTISAGSLAALTPGCDMGVQVATGGGYFVDSAKVIITRSSAYAPANGWGSG